MKTKHILGLSVLIFTVGVESSRAQMSYTMTFTTGTIGHHKTNSTQIQQSEQPFVGIAVSSEGEDPDRQRSSEKSSEARNDSESYTSKGSRSVNIERGHSIRTTSINYKEEYDFATYEFDYSINFEY
ncbi:hypothetical protein [Altericista sp. CCNU0014]|uniref:hypothetical protein n=1 Tax=Altericista sp. CCNU0014 TaxID=3082949 RepID=UPI00384FAC7C